MVSNNILLLPIPAIPAVRIRKVSFTTKHHPFNTSGYKRQVGMSGNF